MSLFVYWQTLYAVSCMYAHVVLLVPYVNVHNDRKVLHIFKHILGIDSEITYFHHICYLWNHSTVSLKVTL